MRKLLCLALLSALASCGTPPPPRSAQLTSPGALPLGPTRMLIDNQGRKVPCAVSGGGMCIQR